MPELKTRQPAEVGSPLPAEEQEHGGDDVVAVGAHLAGSVPLSGAEEVFRHVAAKLGDRLRRIPDGETGPRSDWILWQYPVFSALPQFVVGPPGDDTYRTLPKLRLRDGVAASEVSFSDLGFAETALASYRLFARLKRDGAASTPSPLPGLPADAAGADQCLRRPRSPGRDRADLRAADARGAGAAARVDPGRPARDPMGCPIRVRDARGPGDRVVLRGSRGDPRAAAAARPSRPRRRSSSASTSVTATRPMATSRRRSASASSSRSRTRSRSACRGP